MTSLPPLPSPSDSRNTGGVSVPPSTSVPSSAFSGGLNSMMTAMQQIEAGCQALARQVPSLAPICAETVTKFRAAIPSALAQSAGVPMQPHPPMPGADAGMPPPPPGQEGMF